MDLKKNNIWEHRTSPPPSTDLISFIPTKDFSSQILSWPSGKIKNVSHLGNQTTTLLKSRLPY